MLRLSKILQECPSVEIEEHCKAVLDSDYDFVRKHELNCHLCPTLRLSITFSIYNIVPWSKNEHCPNLLRVDKT